MFAKLHLWFIPHPDNNHRAKLLQPMALLILVSVYLLNQSVLKSFALLRPGILGYSSEITIQKVIEDTNIERQKAGLPPLKYNSTLSRSAADKAQDMFKFDYWAHNSPQGKTPWDFFRTEGYEYSVAGENLARDFYDTDTLIKAWMNSPTHKANILNPKYQEIGIGVVNGTLNGIKTTLVVQHFGTPLNGVLENASASDGGISKIAEVPQVNGAANSNSFIINPLAVSKSIGIFMFVLIIGVLIVDGFIALNSKTRRLTGSNTGHIGFLVIILLLMLFTQQGAIF